MFIHILIYMCIQCPDKKNICVLWLETIIPTNNYIVYLLTIRFPMLYIYFSSLGCVNYDFVFTYLARSL